MARPQCDTPLVSPYFSGEFFIKKFPRKKKKKPFERGAADFQISQQYEIPAPKT
jgi:hypothetical protein